MREIAKSIIKIPVLGRSILLLHRARIGLNYFRRPSFHLAKWLFKSKETTNFTYDLEEGNKRYLASLVSRATGIGFEEAMLYINEIESDLELRTHISQAISKSDFASTADQEMRFGKRAGWYAIARALKPKVIIETGVDKGLGSCVLAAALKKNRHEGHEGYYYGTDINPDAGYLLSGDYADYGKILYGDSIESLKKFDGPIDLFINDSDHSATYEAKEYETIKDKLSERAVILGDNSHCTDKLFEFSLAAQRDFIFFQERPKDHWYPGGGIGISFKRPLGQS